MADSRHRVLIAEDHADSREMLRLALEWAGYEVSEVDDGGDLYVALTTSPARHFGLVITDHELPSMRGLEALARASVGTPFIVVSAAPQGEVEATAARIGAAAFVRKPIDLPPFLRLVRTLTTT